MAPKKVVKDVPNKAAKAKAKANAKGSGALDHQVLKRMRSAIAHKAKSDKPEEKEEAAEALATWKESDKVTRAGILSKFEECKTIKFIPQFKTEMYQKESQKTNEYDGWYTECPFCSSNTSVCCS